MNSDDGFDLFSKNRPIGAVRLTECRSWMNGYTLRDGLPVKTAGNGSGFKLGGSGQPADHEAIRCEAIGNRGYGFTSNSNPRMRLSGCRAGNNRENYVYYFSGAGENALRLTEACREADDPAFAPAAWAQEHLLEKGRGVLSADDAAAALLGNHIREQNERLVRNAVETLSARFGEAEMRKPGLLILCSSLYGGGAERVACHLANGLSERFRVFLLYIQDKGETYPLRSDVEVVHMPVFRGPWQTAMESRIAFTRQLKRILRIRTSISFMFTMNKINVRSKGTETVICSERNNPAKRDPEHLREIEGLYEAADHVVFQSATVRDLFSETVRSHCSIILNPVEISCERGKGRRRIVNVGRLVPQKNQAMLIRAFGAFHRAHPDYTLSFYGIGELSEDLQALAASLGLKDAVRFHGQVRNVHAAIADAEMFALSSDYEGLSNALLECMMMGLPCISTRCEGSSDVIRSGENGLLVDVGSEEQMTAAMIRLADCPALREQLGAAAKKTAEQFKKELILEQWEALIRRLDADPAGDGAGRFRAD